MPSRRTFLAALGSTVFAGCSTTTPTPDDPPAPGVDELPDPDRHIYGANGDWSSFGCNAGNTRTVADGKAPTDGVTERWRVEVPQLLGREPIAVGGRVYLLGPGGLRVFDAGDGSELWRNAEVETTPLVRDGTLYAGVDDRVVALDAASGEPKWERTLAERGSVRAPTTYGGEWLYVPAGETLHRIDAATGEVDWSRRLFGSLLESPAVYSGYYVAVASEAGKLFVLTRDGVGAGEWDLQSRPRAPPTADTDGVYVDCTDGHIYGVVLENAHRRTVEWKANVGWTEGGLAVKERLYAKGTRGLTAVDPETGEQQWEYDTGDWRHTAPALGRDTLFVGGDALYALDPTPESSPLSDGPAVRFERSFHGRVGPGPTLDDGVLYVVAQTGESSFHLLAME
jgi:hypothetical protein